MKVPVLNLFATILLAFAMIVCWSITPTWLKIVDWIVLSVNIMCLLGFICIEIKYKSDGKE
jgi:hypothetical protein